MNILPERSLAPFHTFHLDVNADVIVEATSPADLLEIWQSEAYQNQPKLLLGQGSNMLFTAHYQGVVVLNRIKGINTIKTDDGFHLHIGAGEDWHQLVKWTVDNNMPGLENLALIPGCVGSSPIQNIGAYGVELKDVCEYVDVLDLQTGIQQRLSNRDCLFGYRDSIFKHAYKENKAIIAVGLFLSHDWQPKLAYGPLAELDAANVNACDIFQRICVIRQEKLPDPNVIGNAGSFFKNPVITTAQRDQILVSYSNLPSYGVSASECKLAAGWLIDQCGLKGHQIGGAKVHQQQALVLTNTGTATSKDVTELAAYVVEQVKLKFGITLEHEVRFMSAKAETNLAEVTG
ncbi:UDP-N-acetylmuramate dehydrogenase [Photobacterium kagoshimensis]|uniref:UDP-N-acetylmuramate dehydrogenase n=1 Tax=Photobacterium kagoshimensis TaxID=2910242 RepID=UPI003D13C1FA